MIYSGAFYLWYNKPVLFQFSDSNSIGIAGRAIAYCINNFNILILSLAGLTATFLLSNCIIDRLSIPNWLIELSTYCFGVYILQQFILQFLYYHTSLPFIVSINILPYVTFVITLFGSVFIVHYMLRTKIGKLLIR